MTLAVSDRGPRRIRLAKCHAFAAGASTANGFKRLFKTFQPWISFNQRYNNTYRVYNHCPLSPHPISINHIRSQPCRNLKASHKNRLA
jgi:hypothetical protein